MEVKDDDKLQLDHFNSVYMNDNKKKLTTSKLLVVLTGLIFVVICIFVSYLYLSNKISNAYDVTALVTMISVSGAIFGSNLCWYSKKAASENHYKLRMSLYHDSAKVRLNYNESMIKMMKHYKVTQADIDNIDASGDLDEMMDNAIQDTINDLDTTRDDADSTNEVETFGG